MSNAMSLTEYKKKRNFRRTREPAGKVARRKGFSYVIQKHAASHLHYDFRLELDGVLKSWAVPKGPCLDPKQKRLAMHVEDHPVDYGGFEGTIPQGEYGGGTVMLWDRGSWEPVDDPHQAYREGKLKFKLHGEKLSGGWMLVRRHARDADERQNNVWFLIKERDETAQPIEEGDILEEQPLSVSSGRDLNEIAGAGDRVWKSNRSSNGKAKPGAKARSGKSAAKQAIGRTTKTKRAAKEKVTASASKKIAKSAAAAKAIPGAAKGDLPEWLEPQKATLAEAAPTGDEWLHEIKFDGYRMLCRIDGKQVRFISRNQQDWTSRLPHLVEAARGLGLKQALLDGEVVVMEPDGTTNFQSLQNVFRDRRTGELTYQVFDLLYINGYDLRGAALLDRKQALSQLLQPLGDAGPLRYTEHLAGNGPEFLKHACKLGLEGVVSKRRDRAFQPGRGYDWLKAKCIQRDEFVIGGFTDPSGSRTGFGALLLGYHEGDQLKYAGKVGTGFTEKTLKDLLGRLKPLEQSESPFADRKTRTGPARTAHWTDPQLVAQIEFSNWTNDHLLRHPSFIGLREDKPAEEVVRDKPLPVSEAVRKSTGNGRHSKAAHAGKKAKETRPMKRSESSGTSHRGEVHEASKEEFAGVRLTSPDKELYPEQGITKLELAEYYFGVAEWILPHLANRPLVLVRCPEGRDDECFYQKHPGMGTPKNLRQIPVREKTRNEKYLVVDDVEGLISLVQIGALEIHVWGSLADNIERPNRLIFDLDPDPSVQWPRVVESAQQIRDFLLELKLESFIKTTGGKGLHLVVPIARRHDWDEAKEFCKRAAEAIVAADPKRYTSNMSKAARTNKIFIDYLRNGRGSTAVCAYSTRAKPGAPVSVPLTWEELKPAIRSDQFNVRNLQQRLDKLKQDPWEGIDEVTQSLTKGAKKTLGME
jgi:bifunctional non-homologous end joining protein LigD